MISVSQQTKLTRPLPATCTALLRFVPPLLAPTRKQVAFLVQEAHRQHRSFESEHTARWSRGHGVRESGVPTRRQLERDEENGTEACADPECRGGGVFCRVGAFRLSKFLKFKCFECLWLTTPPAHAPDEHERLHRLRGDIVQAGHARGTGPSESAVQLICGWEREVSTRTG